MVADGTVRFRVLRKMPSHEKLYLLSGRDQFRVITGSANLSVVALSGRQKEVYIVFARVVSKWVLLGTACPGLHITLNRMRSAARP